MNTIYISLLIFVILTLFTIIVTLNLTFGMFVCVNVFKLFLISIGSVFIQSITDQTYLSLCEFFIGFSDQNPSKPIKSEFLLITLFEKTLTITLTKRSSQDI